MSSTPPPRPCKENVELVARQIVDYDTARLKQLLELEFIFEPTKNSMRRRHTTAESRRLLRLCGEIRGLSEGSGTDVHSATKVCARTFPLAIKA